MLKSLIVTPLAVLLMVACGAGTETGEQAEGPVPLESATRELRCGCHIEGIGTCGNYVADGDDWLEISNPGDHNLGKMEWCRVKPEIHVMGTVAGERTGDKVKVDTLLVDR